MLKRMAIFMLAFILCFSSIQVFADDILPGETINEDTLSDNTNSSAPHQEDKPNSWRYDNGVPIVQDSSSYNAAGIYDTSFDVVGGYGFHEDATMLGIDVSEHQGQINWEKVKADGVDFAIIRCGYGDNYTNQDDKYFQTNAQACESLGIPYGVYIYSYATNITMAESEAEHVKRLLNGRSPSLPIYFDMEENDIIENDYAAIATQFCSIIESAGYPVGIYASLYWWDTYLTDPCFDQWYRWVAQYSSTCQYTGEYAIWQYCNDGKVNGISGDVDMNYLIGYPEDHGSFSESQTTNDAINRVLGSSPWTRCYGADRYVTSTKTADLLKKSLGVKYFKNIIVAYGGNYPDALSGSYLAKVKQAPILLVNKATESTIKSYIASNLESGGSVYLLGGTSVISSSFENSLKRSGIKTSRLGGNTRYDTNLKILQAAGVTNEDLLICSANGYADSLSASAVGKPVMIVDGSLSNTQKNYLSKLTGNTFYVIGGPNAVSNKVESQLKSYGSVSRVWGQTRYETSTAVARKFFSSGTKAAVLAYAQNFPDGLSGGPLAMSMGGPLILATTGKTTPAANCVDTLGISRAVVLGGQGLISDGSVTKILQ